MNVEGHQLFSVYDGALPVELVPKVKEEAVKAGLWTAAAGSSYEFGKRSTFWMQTNPTPVPRNNIEKAILHLSRYALPDVYKNRPELTILGAEWWVQIRAGTETIGFHYDKDEAMASTQMILKHPLISTVTYLTDIGAPTLIFNQTSNGNEETPEIPDLAYISYPTFNRHITFSGDLQHGVLGSASKSRKVAQGRVTLLINWWEVMPLEPNTMLLTDEAMDEIGIRDDNAKNEEVQVCVDGDGMAEKMLASRVPVGLLPIGDMYDHKKNKRHEVELPPGDRLWMSLPKGLDKGAWELRFGWEQIWGNMGILDLDNRNQVGQLFNIPMPKVLFMYDPVGKKGKFAFEDMLKALMPLAKTYVGSLKVYFVPTTTAKGVLPAFGLTESDLPALAIDDTVAGTKHNMPKEEFKADQAVILNWLKQHIDLEGKENLHK